MANSFEFFTRRVNLVDVSSRAAMVALAGMMMIAPCEAAFLDQIQGKVLVDSGTGFKPVTGPIVVKAGDRVMAQADGSAIVKYSGNCVAEVKAGAVVYVVGEGACGAVDPGTAGGLEAGAAGLSPLAVGAAVVGAGGLIYLVTKKSGASSP